MNGLLPDVSAEGRARRQAFNRSILDRLEKLDTDSLSAADKVTCRLFKFERQAEAASYSQLDHYYPLNETDMDIHNSIHQYYQSLSLA